MKIIVDGNDGTGKSTLVSRLLGAGYTVADRGLPTKMTDQDTLTENSDEFYLILDASVSTSRHRLQLAGRNLNEKYHTVEDLTHYRRRFLEVAARLTNCAIICAEVSADQVYRNALEILEVLGIHPD